MLLTIVIAILLSVPDDEEEEEVSEDLPAALAPLPPPELEVEPAPPYRFRTAAITVGVLTALLVVVWLLTGFTTSTNAVCAACHLSTIHDGGTDRKDPHESTDCVSCHEPGGVLGRYVTEVPSRILHFVEGATGVTVRADYGRATTSACTDCHSEDIAGVTVNQETGVRMSHAEPLAASATCLDCHVPVKGLVTQKTTGMGTCLRCHDAVTAPSDCSTCHDKKTAAAARVTFHGLREAAGHRGAMRRVPHSSARMRSVPRRQNAAYPCVQGECTRAPARRTSGSTAARRARAVIRRSPDRARSVTRRRWAADMRHSGRPAHQTADPSRCLDVSQPDGANEGPELLQALPPRSSCR